LICEAAEARGMADETACLTALRAAAEELGESPSKAAYEDLGVTPASATIIRTVGGWNEAKKRAGLETNAARGSRVGPKPDDVDATDEEWAAMSVDQRWHYRNRDRNTRRTLDRRRRLREWLRTHKSSLGCSACGLDDPACLDFHHVRGEKERAVNEMVTYGYSAADIHAELQKCRVLCANCHCAAHLDEATMPEPLDSDASLSDVEHVLGIGEADPEASLTKRERLQAWTVAYRRRHRCRRCGEEDSRRLQFHHPDPDQKAGSVGAMIADSASEVDVIEEVERCVVLCANCHRREHDAARSERSDRI
jgi:ribosomal protein L37AE/L43A